MKPISNTQLQQLSQIQPRPAAPVSTGTPVKGPDFASVLADKLKVSSHAQTRLESRDIKLSATDWQRVMDGVDRAAAKGASESLVMIDQTALIVSVKNRTVITAVDQASLKDQVFTNIDSAVIV